MEADKPRRWLATCPRGVSNLLAQEVRDAGGERVEELAQGVAFHGSRASMYRLCLWSRVASRVLLSVGEGAAGNADELYATLLEMPWESLLAAKVSFSVAFSGSNAELRNTRFGAQRCKDAVLDRFRARGLRPPDVRPGTADVGISVRLRERQVDVAVDMAGESLHRRGYRRGTGVAPLKENLAAAMLLRAGWPALASEGAALIDPLCGSATLLVEGALMALDRAPALERERFGFMGWHGHEAVQWEALRAEARARAERGARGDVPEIRGYDADPRVIRRAQENIAAAGLSRVVRVSVKALNEVSRPTHRPMARGLLICNPPYGKRIGEAPNLPLLYRRLGKLMHDEFSGWEAAILAPEPDFARATGLRSHRNHRLYNGRIPVGLYRFTLINNRLADPAPAPTAAAAPEQAPALVKEEEAGAEMLANRLRKNRQRLSRWLKRSGTSCYRLYDADLPEYAVAIDVYNGWLHVAEYRAPPQVPQDKAALRLNTVRAVLPETLGVPASQVVYKRRERQRGSQQYGRRDERGELLTVSEGRARLLVNLHDYLDTGLFLDHRPLRLRIAEEAHGKRFLNLFCYTGTATVHAALGGARESLSIDLSNTYLRWLEKNLNLNGLSPQRHETFRGDVLAWLKDSERQFDLLLLDPPSFSNSSGLDSDFDVQRDHAALIKASMGRLAGDGVLYFSNNRRRFRLDDEVSERFAVEDITRSTLDPDFPRSPPPHRCWRIRHLSD
ncbi:MAG: bifunctional 23S rRNA (guanine(2069)-N(7))-methyltransferase RlmK/23S rRNA (guanine(2445)-N(2))-methyltransferase RlmL [Pseudomonadota bacterium]